MVSRYHQGLPMQVAQAEGEYVRPKLTRHGPLALVGGRHPLLEQQLDCDYQPNDTYLAGGFDSAHFADAAKKQTHTGRCTARQI